MEFMIAAQILAGLWCKWRHGKQWEYKNCRVFPYENLAITSYYCPRCEGEVLTRKRLTDEEAEAFKPRPSHGCEHCGRAVLHTLECPRTRAAFTKYGEPGEYEKVRRDAFPPESLLFLNDPPTAVIGGSKNNPNMDWPDEIPG